MILNISCSLPLFLFLFLFFAFGYCGFRIVAAKLIAQNSYSPRIEAMQREISISSHEDPSLSTLPFTGKYDFAPSMYSSISPSNQYSSILDYLNDGSSNFSSMESEDALAPCSPQFQQQLLNQDLVNRHRTVLLHLRDVAKQAQTLRQENVNLKMANLDLNNRLNLLLNPASFHGVDVDPGLGSLVNRLRKVNVDEEGTSENEATAKSPTSVMDSGQGGLGGPERVHLPKSISVRSNGYLKAVRAGSSGENVVKPSNQNNGTVNFAFLMTCSTKTGIF